MHLRRFSSTGPTTPPRTATSWSARLLIAALLCVTPLTAAWLQAALPPEAYEELRRNAPVAFVGTVVSDSGGAARVKVERVERGTLTTGSDVVVRYPMYSPASRPVAGPVVTYSRFAPGDRLAIWGHGMTGVEIVHQGIDVLTRAPVPAATAGPEDWEAPIEDDPNAIAQVGRLILLVAGACSLGTVAAVGAAVWWWKRRARARSSADADIASGQ